MIDAKLSHDNATGIAHWHIAGVGCFPANDRAKCEAHGLQFVAADADRALALLDSWMVDGLRYDMAAEYGADVANEPAYFLAALEKLATPENKLSLVIEAAKDEIEARHLEATADYGYMDARAEGYRTIQG